MESQNLQNGGGLESCKRRHIIGTGFGGVVLGIGSRTCHSLVSLVNQPVRGGTDNKYG